MVAVYLFIPGKKQTSVSATIRAALPGVFRSLSSDHSWKAFWPGDTLFKLGDNTFILKEQLYNVIGVDINTPDRSITSTLNLIPIQSDLLTIQWNFEQINSSNPFRRFVQYRKALALEKDLHRLVERIKEFMEQPKNIYGFNIKQIHVTDSVLITTRRSLDHEPRLTDVNDMIQSLKKYITENIAVEKNFPMLNVLRIDSSRYEVMTAIPVDRELPLTKEFAPKFLLKGGNILETEVQGGPYTIATGMAELENFKNDYKFAAPAIAYQLLVTDRLLEKDTAKWVTRLYYPIY